MPTTSPARTLRQAHPVTATFLLVLALGGSLVLSPAPASAAPSRRTQAEKALGDRDWKAAGALLEEALKAGDQPADEILYLLGVARVNSGDAPGAVAATERLIKEAPSSSLVWRARLLKARALAKQGRHDDAYQILARRLHELTSGPRKTELAEAYLALAHDLLGDGDATDGPSRREPPAADQARAHAALRQALELEGLPREKEEAARLRLIALEASRGLPYPARRAAVEAYLRRFSSSPKRDAALFALGEIWQGLGSKWRAEAAWRRLAGELPASLLAPKALLKAARLYLDAEARSASRDALRLGLRAVRDLQRDHPKAKEAQAAGLLEALALSRAAGSFDAGRRALEAFAAQVKSGPLAAKARERLAGLYRERGDVKAAETAYEAFLSHHADSPDWPRVRDRLATLRFERAQHALAEKRWDAAIAAASAFLAKHPADRRAAEAAFLIGEAHFGKGAFREAVDAWRATWLRFPNARQGHKARLRGGQTLGEKLGDYEGGLRELERVKGSAASAARRLAARWKAPQLALRSPRVFRSAKGAQAWLVTRNVKSVELRLWRLDLEDYFARTGGVAGLWDLPVEVIAPDKTWTVAVKDPRPLEEREQSVPVPLEGPGAAVLVARSGDREARTVVLVSDTRVLGIATRSGAVVAPEGRGDGKPLAAGTLRVAVIGRERPGLRASLSGKPIVVPFGPKDRGDAASVLVTSKSGSAAAHASLLGLAAPPALKARALVVPARRIVAPGQSLQAWLLVRRPDPKTGRFVAPTQGAFRLVARLGSGPAFFEQALELDAHGTQTVTVPVPAVARGEVRLQVVGTGEAGETVAGEARVGLGVSMRRAPRFELLGAPERAAPGEPLRMVLILRDGFGRPLRDRAIRVRTTLDRRWREERTGPGGEVRVDVTPPGALLASGVLEVRAEGAGARLRRRIPLLSAEVRIRFDDEVERYRVVGEKLLVRARVESPDRKPVAGPLRYRFVRRTPAGRTVEIGAGEATSGADGRVELSLTTTAPGAHTVTLSADGAGGVRVVATRTLELIGPGSEGGLFILAPGRATPFGEPLRIEVYAEKAGPGLVAVSWGRPDARWVRRVQLRAGRNRIELPALPDEVGSATILALLSGPDGVRTDAAGLRVDPPKLTIDEPKVPLRPQQKVEVAVRTRPGAEVWLRAGRRPSGAAPVDLFRVVPDRTAATPLASTETGFAGVARAIDKEVELALARRGRARSRPVSLPVATGAANEPSVVDAFGVGGGTRGGYGQRWGKGQLAREGGSFGYGEAGPPEAEPAPLVFRSRAAGPDGVARFTFRVPDGADEVFLVASTYQDGPALGTASARWKVEAPVAVRVVTPARSRPGAPGRIVVHLTNPTSSARAVGVAIGDAPGTSPPVQTVSLAAWSTAEVTLGWLVSTDGAAAVVVDGVSHPFRAPLDTRVATRRTGGRKLGPASLRPEGDGPVRMRIATTERALLTLLAWERDPLSPLADQAARALALRLRARLGAAAKRPGAAKGRAEADNAMRALAALRASGARDRAGRPVESAVTVFLAEALAKRDGFKVEPRVQELRALFAGTSDIRLRALLLWALSKGDASQYGYAHALARKASALHDSPRALACLALTLVHHQKTAEARALFDALATRLRTAADTDARLLGALATRAIAPANARVRGLAADMAFTDAAFSRWPKTPLGRALLAELAANLAPGAHPAAVRVGAERIAGARELWTEASMLEPEGAGPFYAWAWRAGPPSPGFGVTVSVSPRWPLAKLDGKRLSTAAVRVAGTGHGPAMKRVAAGESFDLACEVVDPGGSARARRVRVALPDGLRVLALARAGGRSRPTDAAVIGGEVVVVLGPREKKERRTYRVTAKVYADVPVPSPTLTVLPAGTEYRQGWTPSLRERLALARQHYQKKRWKEAFELLGPLAKTAVALRREAIVETARLRAYSAIHQEKWRAVVESFEVLKERAPGEVVPFDRVRQVAKAYAEIGEHERGREVLEGTLDATFLREARLVGVLEEAGRRKKAVAWMERLLLGYPGSPLVRDMRFGIGQRLYRWGREADAAAKPAGETGFAAEEAFRRAAGQLERFLAWYPEDERAGRVSLTLGSAYLQAERFEDAVRIATLAAKRYPKSEHRQSFDYTRAFGLFALKRFDRALEVLGKVGGRDYPGGGDAGIRLQARLMRAHIFHARGALDKARAAYAKLKAQSDDAQRALRFLDQEAVALPPVTVAPVGGSVRLPLTYAGIRQARARAYKVDLARLLLKRRGQADLGKVAVAGIRPVLVRDLALQHAGAKRRVTERVPFGLGAKGPGAYVVTVQAGSFFATGLVLVSDLAVTVQEESDGTVRANVTDAKAGGFVEGAKATIFGSAGGPIATGQTDLRGIYETGSVRGSAVVVLEKKGQVALYRGTKPLGVRPRASQVMRRLRQKAKKKLELLEKKVEEVNRGQSDFYEGNVQRIQEGVEVERTKR